MGTTNQTRRILVVDDEKHFCMIMEKVLSREGYEVFCTFNGKDGLERLNKISPDLVVLDVVMPEMDGFEVCRRIRNDKLYKYIPILIVSGMIDNKDKIKEYNFGNYVYMQKPFNINELISIVRTMLERSEKQFIKLPHHSINRR